MPTQNRSIAPPSAPALPDPGAGSRDLAHARPLAEQAEARASAYYGSGYWCAESVLKAVNEVAGHRMPADVTRVASGFCEGFGGSRCICGALAGAVMAAGLLGGREGPGDAWEPSYNAAGELRSRFIALETAATCDEIVARIGDMDDPARWGHCADLVGSSAGWVVEIAQREGWLVG